MAIRIRKIKGKTIAICAAISEAKEGDIYLDDGCHHALSVKFTLDWKSEGLLSEVDVTEKNLISLMKKEQNGKIV